MENNQLTDPAPHSIHARPLHPPIMHQNWGKLLFMHWRIDENHLRPLIPKRLTIDTFDGSAWIAVVPFTMWNIRAFPPYFPLVPRLNRFHELNVRTYVRLEGEPGVWFFSLDAASSIAVMTARRFFHLPYFNAVMSLEETGDTIAYSSSRIDRRAPAAQLATTWRKGEKLPPSQAGSLEFFLTERYCLYAAHKQRIYRGRIFHEPWPLQTAELFEFDSTMIESLGLPAPEGPPLLHYAEELSVDIWPLRRV